mmetsp:Transcript_4536/g.28818  ORF Transcript_4536/g.28818 Transcript_4536/m.28818 type:complete len:205 (+) Transcript_4536:609-1223(+)
MLEEVFIHIWPTTSNLILHFLRFCIQEVLNQVNWTGGHNTRFPFLHDCLSFFFLRFSICFLFFFTLLQGLLSRSSLNMSACGLTEDAFRVLQVRGLRVIERRYVKENAIVSRALRKIFVTDSFWTKSRFQMFIVVLVGASHNENGELPCDVRSCRSRRIFLRSFREHRESNPSLCFLRLLGLYIWPIFLNTFRRSITHERPLSI